MRKIIQRAGLILFLLAAASDSVISAQTKQAPADQTSAPSNRTADAFADLRAEWTRALQTKQIDAIMALYVDDAGFMSADGSRMAGKQAIRDFLQLVFQESSANLVLESRRTDVSGTMASDSGVYWETITSVKSGAKAQVAGSYLMVLRRQPDGKWKIAEQMFTQGSSGTHSRAPAG